MTSEQRKAVRQGLIEAGFKRYHATLDTGDGIYAEYWSPSNDSADVVIIQWGPRG